MISDNPPLKRPHRLAGASGPAAFEAALAAEGVDLDEVLAICLKPEAHAGVLLVGSLSEGTGNATSDVDLLVLLESRDDLAAAGEGLALRAGRAVESLIYRNGVEINIEIYVRSDVERLMEAFVAIAPALYDPSELKRIPMLQPYDMQFLHRLRVGWALRGDGLVDTWRDEFMVDLLTTYLTIRYFTAYNECFEDAAGMLATRPLSSVFVGRMCAEHLLLAVLAKEGHTSQSKKWLLYWSDQARAQVPADLIDEALDLIFRTPTENEAGVYLRRVRAYGEHVRTHIDSDPETRRANDFLRSRISYVELEDPALPTS